MAAALVDNLLVLTALIAFCKLFSCQLPPRFFVVFFHCLKQINRTISFKSP